MPQFLNKPLVTPPLSMFNVTEERVKKTLDKLKPNKSPGLDEFHPKLLKDLADVLTNPLTMIYKRSIDTGEVPQSWRDAIITPIFKKGSRSDAANYRPVSLTSIVCKTLEDMNTEELVDHVQANAMRCLQQHGFVKKHSVTTNILEALNVWP